MMLPPARIFVNVWGVPLEYPYTEASLRLSGPQEFSFTVSDLLEALSW